VLERLGFKTTEGAGGGGIGGPPCRVCGQVAFPGSYLVDSSCYELAQAHEGPRVQGGEVVVIPWCREEAWPFSEEGLPDPPFKGGVGVVHQGTRKGGGAEYTRCELIMGILDSPWVKGRVLWATASIGR